MRCIELLNEVYLRVDLPQIQDLAFIVADGHGFWVEAKHWGRCRVAQPAI